MSIIDNSINDNFHILVSIDEDDTSMNNHDVLVYLTNESKVSVRVGKSKNKIDAINRDLNEFLELCDADIIVNFSDDQIFTVKGFDELIRNEFRDYDDNGGEMLPDLDYVIHFPDQHQGSNCMTMSIIGRDYYNRDNFIYHPEFESLWVDIVAQEEAQIRGCYKFVNTRIFNHLHPSFNDCEYDEQYRKTEEWGMRTRDYSRYLDAKKQYDVNNIFPIRSI